MGPGGPKGDTGATGLAGPPGPPGPTTIYRAGLATTATTGIATVTFATAMPDANYRVAATISGWPSGGFGATGVYINVSVSNKSANGFTIEIRDGKDGQYMTGNTVPIDWIAITAQP